MTTNLPWVANLIGKAKANPQLLLYKLKTNSYKWSWALIPLSAGFMVLLFPFGRYRAYDHVVFVTYSLSFMSLLVAVASVASLLGLGAITAVLLFVPPVHIYRQLRGAYALGPAGALWRTVALTAIAIALLLLFVAAMGLLGALD